MATEIETITDPHQALAAAGPFLERDPVGCTIVASVMTARSTAPAMSEDGTPTGRYWIARDNNVVTGVGMRSPVDFMFSFSATNRETAIAFARELHRSEDDLDAAFGDATMSAAFAGEWATLRGTAVNVSTAQQLYELHHLAMPSLRPDQELSLRLAVEDDLDLLCDWFVGFDQETVQHGVDPEPVVRSKFGALWVLTDGDVACSMAAATPVAAGVRRIQAVFTPADQRGRGYGAAVTARVAETVLNEGFRPVLFTDLANPISNRIYRRLGFEPLSEFMNWSFQ